MNVIYVVPRLDKVSGGPATRITMFKDEFQRHNGEVIEGKNKLKKSICFKHLYLTYVESATNRISFVDLVSLLILRLNSKKIIVFIRDIYGEIFPDEYKTPRKKITLWANRASYFLLTLIANTLVFPTERMGAVFFEKNKKFPKRRYFALPPGCKQLPNKPKLPDFATKLGILYLGSISYTNSGFENFLNFAEIYQDVYNFYVLSGDPNAERFLKGKSHIVLDRIEHNKIPDYIESKNIFVAYHTRPRNMYDDITFPIKVLDFVSFRLPFITDSHEPITWLLNEDYALFVNISDYRLIHLKLQSLSNESVYMDLTQYLAQIARKNSYEERYRQLLQE